MAGPPHTHPKPFPNEIFLQIFSYTAKSDLLAVRLTSHDYKDLANESAFSRIVTRTDKTRTQIELYPSNLLTNFVKRLRVSVVEWLDGQNGPGCPTELHDHSDSKFFHGRSHRPQAKTSFQSLEKEHQALLPGGLPGYLKPVLSSERLHGLLFANGRFNPHVTTPRQCGRAMCSCFKCNRGTLLHFLAGSPKLEELCIDWCSIHPLDTWEDVAERLKATLSKLKNVQLRQLFGPLGRSNPDDRLWDVYSSSKSYDNRFGFVQDFFFRQGVNHFSTAGRALERRMYADGAGEVATAGWRERMKELHG
ncbi:MAG: hypothetical protein Q9169_006953, partial [Polycauliona sp. 2 TL-2023]